MNIHNLCLVNIVDADRLCTKDEIENKNQSYFKSLTCQVVVKTLKRVKQKNCILTELHLFY